MNIANTAVAPKKQMNPPVAQHQEVNPTNLYDAMEQFNHDENKTVLIGSREYTIFECVQLLDRSSKKNGEDRLPVEFIAKNLEASPKKIKEARAIIESNRLTLSVNRDVMEELQGQPQLLKLYLHLCLLRDDEEERLSVTAMDFQTNSFDWTDEKEILLAERSRMTVEEVRAGVFQIMTKPANIQAKRVGVLSLVSGDKCPRIMFAWSSEQIKRIPRRWLSASPLQLQVLVASTDWMRSNARWGVDLDALQYLVGFRGSVSFFKNLVRNFSEIKEEWIPAINGDPSAMWLEFNDKPNQEV